MKKMTWVSTLIGLTGVTGVRGVTVVIAGGGRRNINMAGETNKGRRTREDMAN